MKKILFVMSVAVIIALYSAPSFCKADDMVVGSAYSPSYNGVFPVYCAGEPTAIISTEYGQLKGYINDSNYVFLYTIVPSVSESYINISLVSFPEIYIPTNSSNQTLTLYSYVCHVYNNGDDFYDNIPDEFRPVEPSLLSRIWEDYLDLVENVLGYRPLTYSIYDWLFRKSEGDNSEITFPTMTPSPTPQPTPTQIPVQTIFVPDGNGNTTIIYQYPDPTSGVITQSPYNPNIENNITVNCDCNGGGGSDPFAGNPEDPFSYDASLFWADGFGVEMTENPLNVADTQQATLRSAAMEYNDSVLVMSNSYNILPVKWIQLVGILGGILILAGLIKTFLGG